jgi:hypothetical protein
MSYTPDGRAPIAVRRAAAMMRTNHKANHEEKTMSMQSEGKDAKGRNYDQVTKDGSTSAGTYGTGGTGDVGSMGGAGEGGKVQGETRTDDLLSPAPDEEIGQGFKPAEEAGELQTGLGGIGDLATGNAGNQPLQK